jgi:hypothetical protein
MQNVFELKFSYLAEFRRRLEKQGLRSGGCGASLLVAVGKRVDGDVEEPVLELLEVSSAKYLMMSSKQGRVTPLPTPRQLVQQRGVQGHPQHY